MRVRPGDDVMRRGRRWGAGARLWGAVRGGKAQAAGWAGRFPGRRGVGRG